MNCENHGIKKENKDTFVWPNEKFLASSLWLRYKYLTMYNETKKNFSKKCQTRPNKGKQKIKYNKTKNKENK